jgi:hypothetical protein
MPFKGGDSLLVVGHKPSTRTVIQKETIIREQPIQVLNASLENLFASNLSVLHFSVPDITVFHPKNPHILNESFLDFSTNTSSVEMRSNNIPFLTYTRGALYTNNVSVSLANVSRLCVGRIESTDGNEIGGVFLKDRSLTVPGSAYVGEMLVAKEGAVGGAIFKDGAGAFTRIQTKMLQTGTLHTDNFSCSSGLVLGGIELSGGNLNTDSLHVETDSYISGVRIHNCALECGVANISQVFSHRFDLDNLSLSSFEDRLTVGGGIFTPIDSVNNFGCLMSDGSSVSVDGNLSVSSIEASSGTIRTIHTDSLCIDTEVQAPLGRFASVTTSDITCSELRCAKVDTSLVIADNYTHRDGTPILKNITPPGMITLFAGEVPPRGWMMCDGRGGRPRLASPTQGVIYIVRV